MKAVILAGGEGTRLRPLTETVPKPMVRLCGRPVVEYMLELLAANGVEEAVFTLRYLSEQLRSHFSSAEFAGIRLLFAEEERPLGTAGSVRAAVGALDAPLLVASGDALCDLPLREAVEMHESTGAAATIVTTRVGDPREYGLVLADSTGRVTGFVEKPSFSQATSELANTGIYILSPAAVDMIPQGEKFDFASDLFPLLLKNGMRMQSCALDGYWCDVGDLEAYRRVQSDLLEGRVRCSLPGKRDDFGNLVRGRHPAGRYLLHPPVYLGEGVQIGENAVIGAGSVLDDGCTVAAGATVEGCVLLPHSLLGERASACCAVICAGGSVKSRASLLEGSAVGEDAAVGSRAVVRPGVRLSAKASLPDDAQASDHLSARSGAVSRFDDDGLCGEVGVELTPELAVRVGCAVGSIAGGRPVGIASGSDRCSHVLADALIAGIRSAGAGVLDFGSAFEALFGFGMSCNALTLGVYLHAGEPGAIKLVCDAGLPATRRVEREIELALARGEFTRAGRDGFGDRIDLSGIGVIYLTELLRLCPEGLSGMHASVSCANRTVERLLENVLLKLGCELGDGIRLQLSENGVSLTLSEGETTLDRKRAVAAYCLAMFEQGRDVAVENDFPRALDRFANERGRRVYRYLLCPADDADAPGRSLAAQQQCTRDGLMLAVVLLNYLRKNQLSLAGLDRMLPPFSTGERTVPIQLPPSRLLDGLGERAGEGVVIREEKGIVLLRPRKNGSAIRVFAEAASWEAAQELCVDFEKQLKERIRREEERGGRG